MNLVSDTSAAVRRCLAGSLASFVACSAPQPSQTGGAPSADTARVAGVNERLILAAATVALPPPGVTAADLPDPQTEGAGYIAQFCTACHNLPSPSIHSATDWPGVARRMWLRMDLLPNGLQVPAPSTEQRQVMLDYLIANALQVSGAALPAGQGRGTFATTCSRCHALPDPNQHSAADWPAVVVRMEQRMDQMGVQPPSPNEVQDILLYLGAVSGRRTRR